MCILGELTQMSVETRKLIFTVRFSFGDATKFTHSIARSLFNDILILKTFPITKVFSNNEWSKEFAYEVTVSTYDFEIDDCEEFQELSKNCMNFGKEKGGEYDFKTLSLQGYIEESQ